MGGLAFLVLIAASLLPAALFAFRRTRTLRKAGVGPSPWIYVAALVPAVMFFLMLQSGPGDAREILVFLVLAALVMMLIFWVRELVTLMGLGDEAFPGRHDKILWFLLLVALPPIGMVAFSVFRRAYWPAEKPAMNQAGHEWM